MTMVLRDNSGLKVDDSLRREFPAVFNHKPAKTLSDKYELYRSDEIIERMAERNMKLVEISQQMSRARDPRTQMHSLRFQPLDTPPQFGVNDSVPEVGILNSHNGRNKFSAFAGIFRMICSNGLVVADMNLGTVVRRHFGKNNTFDKVAAIVDDLPAAVIKINGLILDWSALSLDEQEQVQLAKQLIDARGAPDWLKDKPELVLEARRPEEQPKDGERDLWTTFNVLQENLTNQTVQGNPDDSRVSLRPIRGAFRNYDANRVLWTTAEAYYNSVVDGMDGDEQEALFRARKAAYERNRRAAKEFVEHPPETVDA